MSEKITKEHEEIEVQHEFNSRNRIIAAGGVIAAILGAAYLSSQEETPVIKTPTRAQDLGEVVVGKEHGRGFLVRSEDQAAIVCERNQKPDGIIDLPNGKAVVICGNASQATPIEPAE